DPRRSITEPPAPETRSVLYLTVSSDDPRRDSTVTVTANVAAVPGLKAVASFTAHLRYDPGGLAFVAESTLPSGMRALNPQPGHIRAAGAAVEGFADGRLFAVKFRVNDPRALALLELTLDAVNATDLGTPLPPYSLSR